jgi:hypothetical protein
MMRPLVLLHRWLGIPLAVLFAMWFVSGIVMHFVPYPALTDAERLGGLAPPDLSGVAHGPAEAVAASGIGPGARVRLIQRADGPIFVVSAASRVVALRAADLGDAAVRSAQVALAIAVDHAKRRGLDAGLAALAAFAAIDQWTVGGLDAYRPLYRVSLNDGPGTELYVSAATGEVVRDATRRERGWNYAGSVAHWIYPTVLRGRPALWQIVVWTLSLLGVVTAAAGIALGLARIRFERGRPVSPFAGWHAWHHGLGLACMAFVLTWIFSGWLSLDDGLLFSSARLGDMDRLRMSGAPEWRIDAGELRRITPHAKEVEWFPFDGRLYRRDRLTPQSQRLFLSGADDPPRAFLSAAEADAAVGGIASGCKAAALIAPHDVLAPESSVPEAPVYRVVCGDVWLHVDGASGMMLERLDGSQRVYRSLFGALHRLDVPMLAARPRVRTALIVLLCSLGLAFSLTAMVIGWARLRSEVKRP